MPGTVVGVGDTAVNNAGENLCLHEAYILVGWRGGVKTIYKINKQNMWCVISTWRHERFAGVGKATSLGPGIQ